MQDVAYNMLLSGGVGAIYLAGQRILHDRLQIRCRSGGSSEPSAQVCRIADGVEDALRQYLEKRYVCRIEDEGHEIDIESAIEAEVWRRAGREVRRIFTDEEKEFEPHKFIINYTAACQKGFGREQEGVLILTQGIALAAERLEQDVAINAIGSDFTIMKRFEDAADYDNIARTPLSLTLNLMRGMDAAAGFQELCGPGDYTHITILNGASRTADLRRGPSADPRGRTVMFTYQVGMPPRDALKKLCGGTSGRAGAFEICGMDDLSANFSDLITGG